MGLIHVIHIVIHHLTYSQGAHLLLSNGRSVSCSPMMLTSGDTILWFIHSGMRFSGVDMRSIQCVHVLTQSLLQSEQCLAVPNEMHWWMLILLVSISREHNESSEGFNDILALQSVAGRWWWNKAVILIPTSCQNMFYQTSEMFYN